MQQFLCDAVLFDLDGVLVDSTICVERHWYRWGKQYGLDSREIMAVAHGRRTIDTIRLVAPMLDAVAETRLLEQSAAEDYDGLSSISGAAQLLAALPPKRWAVVTSGPRSLASDRLRAVGLPLPDVFITAEDVADGKPHPECYLKAARLLDVRPERCLVLEDAPAGIQAALAAQMTVIAVASTHLPHDLQAASICVPSLAALRVALPDTTDEDISTLIINVTTSVNV